MKPPADPTSALLFDWHRREHRAPWLVAYLLLTVLGLAALFVLFRIVTPEVPKMVSRPQQMMVLNPAVPAERALIHRAMDQSFTLLPEAPGLSEAPEVLTQAEFRSSLAGFEWKLKAPKAGLTRRRHPWLLATGIDVLPPLPVTITGPAPLAPPSKLRIRVEGEMAARVISDTALSGIPLLDPSRPLFRLAIGPLGQVLMALPVSASEEPAVMVKLHSAMTQMRFRPSGQDMEWAQVSFAWEKEAAP